MIVGWYIKLEQKMNNETVFYKAGYQFFTDDFCELATSLLVGPCWKGEGEGYDGSYWQFSCDTNYWIYESQCGPNNCTSCAEGYHWGEEANDCIISKGSFYKWVCIDEQ